MALFAVSGCVSTGEVSQADVTREIGALTATLRGLGAGVDAEEAARAARIAITYPLQLAQDYRVTDPPLIHNTKVNMGLRPRGLCYQWADDIEARLRQEDFRTLEFHRAIANADTIRIDHSTVIVSRRGDDMDRGVVLDGWRNGGRLFWAPTLEDARYRWVPRVDVFAERAAQRR